MLTLYTYFIDLQMQGHIKIPQVKGIEARKNLRKSFHREDFESILINWIHLIVTRSKEGNMIDSRLEDAFALRTDEMILNSGYH